MNDAPNPRPRSRAWFGPPGRNPRSRFWYVMPILFGIFGGMNIIGGIIAWFIVKDDDPPLSKKLLVVGVCLSVVMWWTGYSGGFFEGVTSGQLP